MKQKGQVILIVLIISALVLTIGLSLSRKAVVETKIDTDETLLKQAFNTAESGVDYYLGTGSTSYAAPDTTETAAVTVGTLGAGSTSLDFNEFYIENNAAIFWLVGHNANGDIDYATYYTAGNVNICVPSVFAGSLKIDLFYKSGSTYGVSRGGYNFSNGANVVSGYTDATGASQGPCAAGMKSVNFNLVGGSIPLLISVSPIWSGAKISLVGSAAFPSQGSEISSVGRAGDLQNGVNRKVTVLNRYRVPPFLLEAITAGNAITN